MRAKKILLLGAQAVGKTSIARRLKFDTFEQDYKSTIGVQLHELRLDFEGSQQAVVLWDTDGNFGDQVFESVYVKGAAAAFVVADGTRSHTIDHMLHLINCFEQKLPGRPCYGLINKIDRQMPDADTLNEIKRHTDHIYFCSAFSGEGLQRATLSLLQASNKRDAAW